MENSILTNLEKHKKEFKSVDELEGLINKIKDKKVVMLGEASHGTHEYYLWRAKISKILIEEHGYDFVAVEGDWPPCYALNRYIKNYSDTEKETYRVLQKFNRWPSWMWANWEVLEWAEWLKSYNKKQAANAQKGFYGLDVYSLWESLDAIMEYLQKEDLAAFKTAKKALQCFEPYRDEDGQKYAFSTRLVPKGCEEEVTQMLQEIRSNYSSYNTDQEHAFNTKQNAIIAKNAEEYYRVMGSGTTSTWNLRDKHMMETLNRLYDFHGKNAKAIVWAHNTHIGDASFTDMAEDGLYNIGELAREEYSKENVALVGFGAYKGSVLAGRNWGAKVEEMPLPQARKNSWEEICNQIGSQFYIDFEKLKSTSTLQKRIPHRAVGVVYNPEYEKFGNYVPTIMPERYDAFLFFESSKALNNIAIEKDFTKPPETYPFGV